MTPIAGGVPAVDTAADPELRFTVDAMLGSLQLAALLKPSATLRMQLQRPRR